MGLSVALRISQGDTDLVEAMIRRDCPSKDGAGHDGCANQIRTTADLVVQTATQEGQTTEGRLRDLLTGLRSIDAPKTLILVSQGFFIDGRGSRIDTLASLAAAARTTIYGLAVDEGTSRAAARPWAASPLPTVSSESAPWRISRQRAEGRSFH